MGIRYLEVVVTKLSEMPFKSIKAGMRFFHPVHGEQIILDLDRSSFGPVIKFHNCDIYSGKMPETSDEEADIFQLLAKNTFPCGADEWEYLGMVTHEEVTAHGWHWYEVTCPHCGSTQQLIAPRLSANQRQCLVCGMVHSRPAQSSTSQALNG